MLYGCRDRWYRFACRCADHVLRERKRLARDSAAPRKTGTRAHPRRSALARRPTPEPQIGWTSAGRRIIRCERPCEEPAVPYLSIDRVGSTGPPEPIRNED